MRVAVVGGGISGLAAAFRLREAGAEVVLLEADARLGGKVRTEQRDGFTIEHGPNGFLSSRESAVRLAQDLGLGDRMVPATEAAEHRYLFSRGALRPLPTGPGSFLRSDILSLGGRIRLLTEPFRRAPKQLGSGNHDESVFDFAARRIGEEAARRLVDPMVTGVYAGDAKRLSLPAAFPRLATLEAEHGSLFRGMAAQAKARRAAGEGGRQAGGPAGPGGRLTSFPGGLGEVVDTLRTTLGDAVASSRPVTGLTRREGGGWLLEAGGGDPVAADAVVLAIPAFDIARLLGPHVPAAVEPLSNVPYAAAAVLALGFPADAMPRPLDGFGYLIPSEEAREVLGVLWTSTIFPGRAPDGQVLLRCIVGGVRRPDLAELADDALVQRTVDELSLTMGGAMPAPTFRAVVRWPAAIPQYVLGHLDRVRAAEAAARSLGGIHLAGNGLYGVSLADCCTRAEALPALVLGG